ncbi:MULTISPECIES: TrkH family potassium uptake protein [unclassified Oceanispirochaeta]|uniref:TrkH family potassium uptake protein n=1 Tax=unclassified Oceanispirochaeta TaxID=2635722 RepID=UPI000E09CE8D|nr:MULTISPECIES: TrkH family potassium uptake protein [unclassified Oceanispirochaeta]MBF9014716.1 TrkH family potassium uptake protein [Oceanispirochaeta sp. M2]NPD70972.1 TrkH family potassium uptake protein [Oceanispirochaeta sp. M1]RDG33805.1 TrkH family potassium uptake protein [Oceanispirochaeta sp. M1]
MKMKLIFHVLAILLVIIALFMIIPAGIAFFYGETESLKAFLLPIVFLIPIAAFVYFYTRSNRNRVMSPRDGFMLVSLAWISASALGALPFYLSGAIPNYTDAYFETMSGFTTTGASILTAIEGLPYSILFWRSLTHWLGGMGIVVLTVAIFPLLGIGGLQLLKAEAPGPSVDKITPKIAHTAKYLWFIYLGLTVLETILLMLGGMNLFDSLTHAFGTMATGGFSPKNTSVGFYDSAWIHWVITIFMILAGMNFALYFKLLTGRIKDVLIDTEMKAYLGIFAIASLAITFSLLKHDVFDGFFEGLQYAAFQVASIITTTGFATTDYDIWPEFSKTILFLMMFVGGCAGSTGGGMKVVRIVTLFKLSVRELKRLIYPRAVFHLRLNKMVVRKDIISVITGFVFLYVVSLLVTTVVVSGGGYDILTSFSTALVTVGNIGPGFNLVGPTMNYSFFQPGIKWFLSLAMMMGRLEIYTVLVLFTPHFWKKL